MPGDEVPLWEEGDWDRVLYEEDLVEIEEQIKTEADLEKTNESYPLFYSKVLSMWL